MSGKLTHIWDGLATFFHQERREVVRGEVRIFAGGVGRVKMPCESEIGRETIEEREDKRRNWKRVGRGYTAQGARENLEGSTEV